MIFENSTILMSSAVIANTLTYNLGHTFPKDKSPGLNERLVYNDNKIEYWNRCFENFSQPTSNEIDLDSIMLTPNVHYFAKSFAPNKIKETLLIYWGNKHQHFFLAFYNQYWWYITSRCWKNSFLDWMCLQQWQWQQKWFIWWFLESSFCWFL